MSLFLYLPHTSFGQYFQQNVKVGGCQSLEKIYREGRSLYSGLYMERGSKLLHTTIYVLCA